MYIDTGIAKSLIDSKGDFDKFGLTHCGIWRHRSGSTSTQVLFLLPGGNKPL